MALDAGIYGNLLARPRSAMEYQQDYAAMDDAKAARQLNALAMQEKRAQLADADSERQQRAGYANLLAQNAGRTPDELIPALERAGTPYAMTQAQALRKAQLEAQAKQVGIERDRASTTHSAAQTRQIEAEQKQKALTRAMDDVMAAQSPQQAMQLVQQYSSILDPAALQGMTRELMGVQTPEQMDAWKYRRVAAIHGLKTAEDMKRQQRESASTLANRDLIEDPTQPGRFIVNAPLNEAKVQRAAAGAAQAPGMTYMTDAGGNIVGLPTKAPLGRTVVANVVRDAGGTPLPGKDGGMTEDQGKASGWLAQATTAFDNMEKARSGAKPGIGDFVGRVPLMGDVGNAMRPEDRQLFVQAAESLSEALLRAATGAGVNRDEAAQKIREITPQFGDSDKVIAQKRAAVPIYLKSLEARAGRKGTQAAQQATGSAGVSAPTAAPAFGLDPAAIAAELAKRGVK